VIVTAAEVRAQRRHTWGMPNGVAGPGSLYVDEQSDERNSDDAVITLCFPNLLCSVGTTAALFHRSAGIGAVSLLLAQTHVLAHKETGPSWRIMSTTRHLGALGRLANRWFMVPTLRQIFGYRSLSAEVRCVFFVSYAVRRGSISPTFSTFLEAVHAGLFGR
jgi:hypothetical protein